MPPTVWPVSLERREEKANTKCNFAIYYCHQPAQSGLLNNVYALAKPHLLLFHIYSLPPIDNHPAQLLFSLSQHKILNSKYRLRSYRAEMIVVVVTGFLVSLSVKTVLCKRAGPEEKGTLFISSLLLSSLLFCCIQSAGLVNQARTTANINTLCTDLTI